MWHCSKKRIISVETPAMSFAKNSNVCFSSEFFSAASNKTVYKCVSSNLKCAKRCAFAALSFLCASSFPTPIHCAAYKFETNSGRFTMMPEDAGAESSGEGVKVKGPGMRSE